MRSHFFASLGFMLGVIAASAMAGCTPAGTLTPTSAPTAIATATRPPVLGTNEAVTPMPEAAAQSALIGMRDRGAVRVGILYNYPPFGVLTDDGQVEGYEAELVRQIAERWGVEVEFVQVTRQTRLPLLTEGDVDLIAGAMPHRRELEAIAEFSDTTFRSGYVILTQASSGIQTSADIGAGPVGLLGSDAQDFFASYAAQQGITPTIQPYETADEAASALSEGAVRAIVGRREQVMLASLAVPDAVILNEFLYMEPYAFAVRRGDTPLRELINLTLQDIAAEGAFGELFTANFFGYAADQLRTIAGESTFTLQSFPVDLATTASIVERIKAGEALRVAGMNLSAAPASFDSQPIIDGYNRAIVNEMARRWNVPVVEVPDTSGEAGLPLLQSGQADIVVGIRPNQSLIGVVAVTQPYYTRGLRMIHMNDVTVYGIGDLEGKPSMAVPPVETSEDVIRDNNGAPRIQTAESFEDAFDALTSRGVYALVGDEYALMLMAQSDERIEVDERLYRPTEYVMAVPRGDSDFLALVNFTLQNMALDGTLDQLRSQYFGPYIPEGAELEAFSIEIWPGVGEFLGVNH